MGSVTGGLLEPLARVRQRSRADAMVALALRVVLTMAVVGVVAGVVESALWDPGPSTGQASAEVCHDPPCPPESLPDARHLPLLLPPLGYLLAALLGLSAAVQCRLTRGGAQPRRRSVLPVLGPVVVLVALEVVPHVVNPCLVADAVRGSLPSGCSRTVHGVDVHDRWHVLHHAVVGGLAASLGYAALLRRRRPELFTAAVDATRTAPSG